MKTAITNLSVEEGDQLLKIADALGFKAGIVHEFVVGGWGRKPEPEIVKPRYDPSYGNRIQIPHLLGRPLVHQQWLEAINYCMAVAREIGMERGCDGGNASYGPLRNDPLDNYIPVLTWGTSAAFFFKTPELCKLFIRSVGQDRLNIVFGVKA